MMPKVELIYDRDCPNVEAARQQLRRAFEQLGQSVQWDEWDRGDPSSPDHARHYGSPTILVDGKDVFGASPLEGADCCRVYHSQNDGFGGVPPVEASRRLCETAPRRATTLRVPWGRGLPCLGLSAWRCCQTLRVRRAGLPMQDYSVHSGWAF